jgi:NAD(P) transhydrogenase subunit alpha
MEQSAGAESHFLTPTTVDVGMVNGISEAYGNAGLILRVTPPSPEEIAALPEGSVLIGLLKPFEDKARLAALNARKITAFSLELLPRISRAQSMDALSSQASCAGYQCGLIAAARCTKFFPMLTTAAGTIRPARVLVIGAGVAGLQAIATCKRLGAMVEAYDVRSAAREQIESLGAKFVDTGVSADGAGGYARDLTAEEKAQQTEKLAKAVAMSDVVITTAAIPGKKAPIIITTDMISRMKYGAIIVDMAAESGGNCALTQPGEHVIANDVNIHGPLNLPSRMPTHASELYAKNIYNFISPWIKDGELVFDWSDEVVAGTLLCKDGATVHGKIKQILEKPDGRPARALYLHARRLHRLRDHRQGAGHPAHAADVRFQLHPRRRVVGAMIMLGSADTPLQQAIGFFAVALGAANAAGGYVVTERMLAMFKKKDGCVMTLPLYVQGAWFPAPCSSSRPERHEFAGQCAQGHRLGRLRHADRHCRHFPRPRPEEHRADGTGAGHRGGGCLDFRQEGQDDRHAADGRHLQRHGRRCGGGDCRHRVRQGATHSTGSRRWACSAR